MFNDESHVLKTKKHVLYMFYVLKQQVINNVFARSSSRCHYVIFMKKDYEVLWDFSYLSQCSKCINFVGHNEYVCLFMCWGPWIGKYVDESDFGKSWSNDHPLTLFLNKDYFVL
jgi:hypothetical protein